MSWISLGWVLRCTSGVVYYRLASPYILEI
jgi:hypothetical protein